MPPITGKARVERLQPCDRASESAASTSPSARVAIASPIGHAGWSPRTCLTVDDLVWPLFLCEGKATREPIVSMPGVVRYSVDEAIRAAEQAVRLKIPALALFPEHGSEASR